jgi:hypothetical protein
VRRSPFSSNKELVPKLKRDISKKEYIKNVSNLILVLTLGYFKVI